MEKMGSEFQRDDTEGTKTFNIPKALQYEVRTFKDDMSGRIWLEGDTNKHFGWEEQFGGSQTEERYEKWGRTGAMYILRIDWGKELW